LGASVRWVVDHGSFPESPNVILRSRCSWQFYLLWRHRFIKQCRVAQGVSSPIAQGFWLRARGEAGFATDCTWAGVLVLRL
jgi:hypothetical protein